MAARCLEQHKCVHTLFLKMFYLKYFVLFYDLFIYLLFYVTFNSQGHIATGSLQVEETSGYCTVNHRASASNYQLSNMKRPARDSNRRPQRLEARTLTTTPPSPLFYFMKGKHNYLHIEIFIGVPQSVEINMTPLSQ